MVDVQYHSDLLTKVTMFKEIILLNLSTFAKLPKYAKEKQHSGLLHLTDGWNMLSDPV